MTPEKRARLFAGFDEPEKPGLPAWLRLTQTPEEVQKAYRDECRNAAKVLPPWAYHRDWLNAYALDLLPAVCAAVGTGRALITLDRPAWWPSAEPGRVIGLRATPDAWHMLFIDRASGFWMEPTLSLRGPDLIALVERRLSHRF